MSKKMSTDAILSKLHSAFNANMLALAISSDDGFRRNTLIFEHICIKRSASMNVFLYLL